MVAFSGARANVRGDMKEITKHLDKTQRRIIPLATASALNKTAAQINTKARSIVAKDIGVAQKHINRKFKVFKANRRNWSVKNWIGTQVKIPVSKVFKDPKKQINYTKKKNLTGGKTPFIARMKSGHSGPFYRKGEKRLPIKEAMIDISDISTRVLATVGPQIAMGKFRALFARELEWRLKRKY